ncbi:hypothetical protein [Xanthomonas campestris]|uniref:hypothetical protein n=1 Tax=Xanthomonas campestris TaxID=339 RepID=UPI00128FDD05|nr:hypothetical protein [Xanthomonas campestris]
MSISNAADHAQDLRRATVRRCSRCAVDKNHGQFTLLSSGKPHSWCRACCAEKKRLDRLDPAVRLRTAQANQRSRRRPSALEHKQVYQARAYETSTGRARALHNSARQRARQRGQEFNLSLRRVLDGIESGKCERTGIAFEMKCGFVFETGRQANPRSPSIDRIDPFKPYSDDNVQIVCTWYNKAKEQLTDMEMLSFCESTVRAASGGHS